ncbi:hypothetical protein Pfl04_08030 [Planosporangium flavigriseum]|uniref:Uncharacterized protein n=1 Tax=Planosporangium flavigriseum TaxID=373681 RepID=A0A8J3LR26_9ACTN|nr:hypothetical protein Pfl04_08030 [Planosporangium flavigriseum]
MSFSSVAEYSFTEMDTSPKETAPFQMDRIPQTPLKVPPYAPRGGRRWQRTPAKMLRYLR